jgi:putative FmdB family regulatory protein
MPIYEFFCSDCCKGFEALVGIGKEKDVVCPRCQGKHLKKCVSAFGIGGGADRTATASSSCSTCTSGSCDTCS